MSNFSKNLWDTDIKHFAEKYGEDVCNAILKMMDGEYEEFKEEYGVECFTAIERLLADELEGEELRSFIDNYGEDFVQDIKMLAREWVFTAKNMNSLIFNFLPSKIRGVYRFDASLSEIESKDDVSTYVEHKLSFIPSEYASLFAEIAGSASTGGFYSSKVIQDNQHHSSLRGKIKEYFSNYPYFNNHVDREDEESVNWLEAQFVRKILAPILTPAGMLKVEPQKEVRRRKPDFAVEGEKKYVFEVDGFGKFKQRSDLDNFLRRQNMLAAAGWIVYRFSYTDIIQHSAVTKRVIYDIFKNDPALKSFLCDSSQISLFEDTTSPSLTADPFEIVNSFYLVQDYFAGQLVENGWDSGTRINIQDGFTFDFPFVATALSALYKFLNSIEKICEVNFDLPEISVLGSANNNSKLQLHPLIKISHSADDTSEIEITPAVIRQNKPSLINLLTDNSEVSVNFRSNLDLQTIKEGLAYITDSVFKYEGSTKHFQNQILKEIFDGRDVLGIFPTGSGKSFCFWLPALIKPGITIVICPLKSLMRDQCSTLENYGIYSAAYITSDIKDKVEREQIILDAMLGKIKILYVAPERIRINKFLNDLERLQEFVNINYLVIDEAHCISEWGHDFRPSYLNIPFFFQKLKMKNPGIQLIALTATAGQMIRKDIINILHLRDGEGGNVKAAKDFDRERFSYQIVPVRNSNEKQEAFETTLLESIPIALKTTELDEVLQNTNHRREKGVGIIYSIYADPHGMHSVYDGIAHYMYQTKALLGEYGENNHYGLNDYGTGRVRAFSSKSPTLCPNCNSYDYVAYPKAPKQRNEEEVEEDEDIENAELGGGKKRCRNCGHVFTLNSQNAVRPTNYDKQTRKNQEDFKKGAIDILVATKGFGMGIDKGSVRFVLHTSLSSGIESWYQEAGRAGRDSERAHCIILADFPKDQCISDLNKKILKAPPCYNTCPYGRESLCDYGKQHVFIKRSYPGIESDVVNIVKTFDRLINAFFSEINVEGWVTFQTTHTKLKSHELALFRLKLLGIVQDFFVEYKDGVHFKVRLNICKNTEGKITINTRHDYLVANLIRYLNQNKLYSGKPDQTESTISKKIDECKAKHDSGIIKKLERLTPPLLHYEGYKSFYHNIIDYLIVILDYTYNDILKMRYQSLWNLFEVIQNEKNECRRRLILPNFGDKVFIKEGYRCNLCDSCIEDLDFPVDSRVPPEQTDSEVELQKQLEDTFLYQVFDFDRLISLRDAFHDYPAVVYRRSCGILEGNAVNFAALFFCREFAPNDEKEAYSLRLLEAANKYLDFESITRIYDTSPSAYRIKLLLLLNDKYGRMNSDIGIRWIYEESKRRLKTSNDKGLSVLHETLGFLYLTGEMKNTYTGRLDEALSKLEVMTNG